MGEILAEFAGAVTTTTGVRYAAQAWGTRGDDGLWEGWIEFVPLENGPPIRSPRETTQPNRADAVYWATGLSAVYLEGALERALDSLVGEARPAQPFFDALAPSRLMKKPAT